MTGRLVVKGDKYYVVISYKDENGKYKNKWVATGLDEKNNKRAATDLMREIVTKFENGVLGAKLQQSDVDPDNEESPLFSEYLYDWLQMAKPNIQVTTYSNYLRRTKVIADYFGEKQKRLKDLKPRDIQDFYTAMQEKGKTVQECHHLHTIIHRALQVAYRGDYIQTNPADKVERPKSPKYKAKFYTAEQMRTLFKKLEGDPYEHIYKMTAIYGFRRSEIVGLRWSSIDFDNDTITLDHAVVQCEVEGKRVVIAKDKMKNQSSMRTLPILPVVKEILLSIKREQEEKREKYGRYYNNNYIDYVAVTEIGDLIRPDTLTTHFKTFLVRNNLPIIRLHDLRHSCASILIACGVSMKAVQEWLGHSTFSTTADIYSHLNYSSKLGVAGTLTSIFEGKPVQMKQVDDDLMETMQKIFTSTEMNATIQKNKAGKKSDDLEILDEDIEERDDVDEEVLNRLQVASEDKIQIINENNKETESVTEYRMVKEEMDRLGFHSLDEYFEYLDYTERIKQRAGKRITV